MKIGPEDRTEEFLVPPELFVTAEAVCVATRPEVDADTLRRARRHGSRARLYFPEYAFEQVESELRAGWLLNGETARWREVRNEIQAGFEAR